jgi:O-antigen ligase
MPINWQEPRFITIIIVSITLIVGLSMGQIITGLSSTIVIAIILGVLVFLVTLVNTDAGLAVLIFSMLLSPEILVGQIPGRDIVIRFEDLLLPVITFAWFAKTAINKGLALFIKTPLNKAIGVYIFVFVISTLRGIALGYVTPAKGLFYVLRYIEYFLLFILVANQVHSRKQIKFFLNAFLITCALVSAYGILQIPTGGRVSAPFEGEVGEPNTLGGYLLFILCIVVGIFLQNVPKKLKIRLACLAVLIFIPFLFTLSRASYIAIIFSFIAFIIFSKRRSELIMAVVVIALVVIILRPEAVFSRVGYTFQQKQESSVKIGNIYLDSSSSARIFSWQEAFKAWKKNPVLGRGVTGFMFLDGQYVLTLPELGIIGFLSFLWLLWTIYKQSLHIFREMDDALYKGLTLGFIAGFIGLTIHALTANTFIIIRIMEPFWFIAAIVMMLPRIKKEEEEEAQLKI